MLATRDLGTCGGDRISDGKPSCHARPNDLALIAFGSIEFRLDHTSCRLSMTKTGTNLNRRDWVVAFGLVIGTLLGVRSGLAQQPCQPVNFAAPFPIWGVDSAAGCGCAEVGWDARGNIPWQE